MSVVLSIITPTRNSEKKLINFFSSIPRSVSKKVEFVFIDCASEDNTMNTISQYKDVLNIKSLSEKDNGIYFAMNKGILLASGRFLYFVNSDDTFDEFGLISLIKVLESSESDLIVVSQRRLLENNNSIIDTPDLERRFRSGIPHQCVIFSKILFKQYGNYDTKFKVCADYELILRFKFLGAKIKSIPILTVNYSTDGFSSQSRNLFPYYREMLAIWSKYDLIKPLFLIFFTFKTILLFNKKIFLSFSKFIFKKFNVC